MTVQVNSLFSLELRCSMLIGRTICFQLFSFLAKQTCSLFSREKCIRSSLGRLRVPKVFRFQLPNEKFFSANSQPMLNLSASSVATLSPLLSSNVSSYIVNGSSPFEARRAWRRAGSPKFSLPFVIARGILLRICSIKSASSMIW